MGTAVPILSKSEPCSFFSGEEGSRKEILTASWYWPLGDLIPSGEGSVFRKWVLKEGLSDFDSKVFPHRDAKRRIRKPGLRNMFLYKAGTVLPPDWQWSQSMPAQIHWAEWCGGKILGFLRNLWITFYRFLWLWSNWEFPLCAAIYNFVLESAY